MSTSERRALRKPSSAGEAGATMIEVLIVVAIIGILANILIPVLMHQLRKARVRAIVSDFIAVRQAAFEHQINTGRYPADGRRGREPAEFAPYLKGRVNWNQDRRTLQYDWEYWVRPNGRSRRPGTGVRVGFSIRTRDPNLRQLIIDHHDGPISTRLRNKLVFIIEPHGRRASR